MTARPVGDGDGHDELREALVEAVRRHLDEEWIARDGDAEDFADHLLPVVTAYAEQRARERAAKELRAAVDWLAAGAAGRPGPLRLIARKLHDRADALAAADRTGQP